MSIPASKHTLQTLSQNIKGAMKEVQNILPIILPNFSTGAKVEKYFISLYCKKKGKVMGRKSKIDVSFKAKVALEAIKAQKTLTELAKEYKVSPSKITV